MPFRISSDRVLRAARLTLEQRNYTLGNTSMVRTAAGEPLTIQQQDPQPGTQEGADPTVNVLVSSGRIEDSFVMPDIVGKRLGSGCCARSQPRDFQPGKITLSAFAREWIRELLFSNNPRPGIASLKSDSIVLEVSQ